MKSPLYVSKRNRKGVFYLVLISLLIIFTPRIIDSVKGKQRFKVSSYEIEEFRKKSEERRSVISDSKRKMQGSRFRRPARKFDPNQYMVSDWIALGLSEKQASVVVRFAERGIRNNEELRRIFVIPEELFDLISDSTVYSISPKRSTTTARSSGKQREKIELNSADQPMLESIPGIGPYFARNIIRYRERLGGFHSSGQLMEVPKMDPEKLASLEPFLTIDPDVVRKFRLNQITAKELSKHPYLNWNIANSIVKIRDRKGGFKSVDEIKESVLIDEELFEKIKPYLTL